MISPVKIRHFTIMKVKVVYIIDVIHYFVFAKFSSTRKGLPKFGYLKNFGLALILKYNR
jgi:hypothetical protein